MQTNWDVVYNSCDPNEAYDAFVSTFVQIFNRCFPFKQANRKLLTSIEKPWISYALLKSINTKKKLYKRYLHNPISRNNDRYKSYKNKLTQLLRTAKLNYYESQIEKG